MNGILMTLPNHEAIRKLLKDVTRRTDGLKELNKEPDKWKYVGKSRAKHMVGEVDTFCFRTDDGREKFIKPRYHVGETVYVKEEWATLVEYDSLAPCDIPLKVPIFFESLCNLYSVGKIRSPMFLRGCHARDFIQITSVRPGRAQEITEEDCYREGNTDFRDKFPTIAAVHDPIHSYAQLWDSINGKKYPWSSNPWVWRIEFKLVRKDGKEL